MQAWYRERTGGMLGWKRFDFFVLGAKYRGPRIVEIDGAEVFSEQHPMQLVCVNKQQRTTKGKEKRNTNAF